MAHADPDILDLLRAGRELDAARLYQDRFAVSLEQAMEEVESLRELIPPSKPASDDDLGVEVEQAILQGKKIEAIKLLRERTGRGLAEAKDAVDRRAAQLGAPAGSRCFIAAAAFDGPTHDDVRALRLYREHRLRPTIAGRALIGLYERLSPPIARAVERSPTLRALVRAGLRPLARRCRRR